MKVSTETSVDCSDADRISKAEPVIPKDSLSEQLEEESQGNSWPTHVTLGQPAVPCEPGSASCSMWTWVSRLSHVDLGQPAVPRDPGSAGCPMWTWVSCPTHVNLGQLASPCEPGSASCPMWTWVSWPVHVTLGQLYPWFYSFGCSERELLGINGCAFYVPDLLPVTQPAVTCILSRACWVFLVWCYFVQYTNIVQEFCLTLTVRWRGNKHIQLCSLVRITHCMLYVKAFYVVGSNSVEGKMIR